MRVSPNMKEIFHRLCLKTEEAASVMLAASTFLIIVAVLDEGVINNQKSKMTLMTNDLNDTLQIFVFCGRVKL